MIIPMLREMRAEMANEFGQVKKRLEALESGQRNIRAALAGETVLARVVVGEFEERLEALEKEVKALAGQR
jgi:polyhydroxyalkanoate synthesis regulator phasin